MALANGVVLNLEGCILNAEDVLRLERQVDNCPICRNSFLEPSIMDSQVGITDVRLTQLDCGHIYHASCIVDWSMRRLVCPLDNTDLRYKNRDDIEVLQEPLSDSGPESEEDEPPTYESCIS